MQKNNEIKSVAGVIFSKDKKEVLLIKRRDVPVWVLPGGGRDEDEDLENAIIREILEETGFTVKVKRIVGQYLPINKLAKVTNLYECEIISGNMALSDETSDVKFFNLENLPDMPPPYFMWIHDAIQNTPFVQKHLNDITYLNLFLLFIKHPILVFRFILARIGLPINH
jgi:8-oxo-dGTP diphosphatase